MDKKLIVFVTPIICIFLLSLVNAVTIENLTADTGFLTQTQTAPYGNQFNTTSVYIRLINVTKVATSTATTAYLQTSAGANISSATFVGNVATFSSPINLNLSTNYKIVADATGSSYDRTYKSLQTFPVTGKYIIWNSAEGGDLTEYGQTIAIAVDPRIDVNLTNPINNTGSINTTITFQANHSIISGNLTNSTLFVWLSNGTLYTTNQSIITGSFNTTSFIVNNLSIGNYIWNQRTCGNLTEATNCNFDESNFTLSVGSIKGTPNYNTTIYETAKENISITITPFNSTAPTSANLTWNNTNYTATITNLGNGNYSLNYIFDVPLTNVTQTIPFNFSWMIGSTRETSSTNTQSLNRIVFQQCNGTYTTQFINFTFYDETSLSTLTGNITSGLFIYWLGNGILSKSFSYTNTSSASNYSFCFSPNTQNISSSISFNYVASGYNQRSYSHNLILTNSTTNVDLPLLADADGLFVTFQVLSPADQPISGVSVNATRTSLGTLVGSGSTDDAGTITFFLNPDFQHTFVFVKTGYDTFTLNLFPTQSQYTVTLGQEANVTTDLGQGISYVITPSQDIIFMNNLYNFSFNLSSIFYELDSFGFSLYYANGSLIGSNSSTISTGEIIYLFGINVSNGTSVYMIPYYIIDGNTTTLNRRVWLLQSTTGTEFGIKRFFEDLTSYIDTGFFGMDDFGKALLSLIFVIVVAGGLSAKYGLGSEGMVMGVIFGCVFFLDVGLGFISTPTIADRPFVEHFPTILMFFILLVILIKEEQY